MEGAIVSGISPVIKVDGYDDNMGMLKVIGLVEPNAMLTVHAFVGITQTLRRIKAGVDLNARMRCLSVKEQQVEDMDRRVSKCHKASDPTIWINLGSKMDGLHTINAILGIDLHLGVNLEKDHLLVRMLRYDEGKEAPGDALDSDEIADIQRVRGIVRDLWSEKKKLKDVLTEICNAIGMHFEVKRAHARHRNAPIGVVIKPILPGIVESYMLYSTLAGREVKVSDWGEVHAPYDEERMEVTFHLVTPFTGTGNVRTEKIDKIKLDAEYSRLKELSRPTKRDLQTLEYFENHWI